MTRSITTHPKYNFFRELAKLALPDGGFQPELGIILGSGFQSASGSFEAVSEVSFADLPGFPQPGVEGHSGQFGFYRESGMDFCMVSGRIHYYEGHAMDRVVYPLCVMAAMGVKKVILTNAAGLIRQDWHPGEFMVVSDHLNLMGSNPLIGLACEDLNLRFTDLSRAYDPQLFRILKSSVHNHSGKAREGVYAALSGPAYETPAEIRMLRTMGADAVGMSTVPEVIMARFLGLEVAAMSCLTNWAAGIGHHPLSHQEVLETGDKASEMASKIVKSAVHQVAELPG